MQPQRGERRRNIIRGCEAPAATQIRRPRLLTSADTRDTGEKHCPRGSHPSPSHFFFFFCRRDLSGEPGSAPPRAAFPLTDGGRSPAHYGERSGVAGSSVLRPTPDRSERRHRAGRLKARGAARGEGLRQGAAGSGTRPRTRRPRARPCRRKVSATQAAGRSAERPRGPCRAVGDSGGR